LPLLAAFVRPVGKSYRLTPTTSDGGFSVEYSLPGGYFLWCGGVHHQTILLPLLLTEQSLSIFVQLAGARVPDREPPFVVGTFNDFRRENAVPMRSRADGSYTATVATTADSVAYRIAWFMKDVDLQICGTQFDRFAFDRRRPLVSGQSANYVAVISSQAPAIDIVFNPQRIPPAGDPVVTVERPMANEVAAIIAIDQVTQKARLAHEAAYMEHLASGQSPETYVPDMSLALEWLRAEMSTSTSAAQKQFAILNYFQISTDRDSMLARAAVHSIPPASPLWSLVWPHPFDAFDRIATSAAQDKVCLDYARRATHVHADSTVRAAFLFYQVLAASRSGRAAEFDRCVAELLRDYPHSTFARRVPRTRLRMKADSPGSTR